MDTSDLMPLLEQLEDDIDDIDEVLEPLLNQTLSATTKKMPLMDKAKLHVLITYTIESLLFSYLRLHGVNAKEHPVFKELTRVKQYFEKIKNLETVPEKRNLTLDKSAASRFIKHGLAGNDKHDLERAEREAKEKAMAQLRAAQLAKRKSIPQKRPVEDNNRSGGDTGDGDASEPKKAKAAESTQDDDQESGFEQAEVSADTPATPAEDDDPEQKLLLKKEKKRIKNMAKRQRKAAEKKAKEGMEANG